MRSQVLLLVGLSFAGMAAVAAFAQVNRSERAEVAFQGAPVTAQEIVQGKELYAQNCASCHGPDLEGQPDWKRPLENGRMPAPPHDETGHTWHHSDNQLFTLTKLGISGVVPGYESDMPAFEGILTDAEIRATLAYIKSTWPKRQYEYQAEVSDREGPEE
ncbi:MAG: cytochrome c [Paracoccus sp. (in: a-proteobacteria)]|jgi:mono/diheme cytochrome c family protein|uniref:c-type cytochrome n=1 Tax=Paracoccus TaxID=265 RepID=UPI00209422CE|nr:cytochrome c [Paracoccus sp. 08]MCO6361818.1 c-type cytochrome [Paracoccus sp. 08]